MKCSDGRIDNVQKTSLSSVWSYPILPRPSLYQETTCPQQLSHSISISCQAKEALPCASGTAQQQPPPPPYCHPNYNILSLFLLFASVHSVRRTQGRALLEPREVAKVRLFPLSLASCCADCVMDDVFDQGQGEEGGGSVAAASCADCVMDGVFDQGQGEEGGGSVAAAMIGSRPPRCEGRCLSCGQCEAIQVPAIPQDLTPVAVSSRGDEGSSIYKPLSWKCKCGGMILNP
ncbi:hypothetical protein ZIOFF_047995 [Zingiber officinale]|uniref:Epidermal patterning factor-like protein n=1 Tax=Zingiber officinale TaxID=94328 RepID=A0A8J5KRP0_ZINOF|nr:hypothetical protein ZIOFF_047995 [Zingiber officinale]